MASHDEFLTVEEVADRLGRSVATIRRYCATGQLDAVKVGRGWLIKGALPSRRRPTSSRRPRSASSLVDLPLALIHLRTQDLRNDVWVPDVLRFEDDLRNTETLFSEAASRLDLETAPDPAASIPVPKSPVFPRNAVDLSLVDRIAYQAAVGTFASQVHDAMTQSSYAARPATRTDYFLANGRDLWLEWRSDVITALEVDGPWMAETDITSFFDFIKHELLLPELQRLGAEVGVINAIREMLRTWSITPNTGLPQGPNASRLLANFYMAPIDAAMEANTRVRYFRYMDDIRIVGESRAAVIGALQELDMECRRRGLALSTKKTELRHGDAALESLEEQELDRLQYAFDSGTEEDKGLRGELVDLFKRSLGNDGTVNTRRARFSLGRLFRLREQGAVRFVLRRLEHLGPLRDIVPKYLHPWMRKGSVQRRLTEFLQDSERNTSPFLSTWIMAAMVDLGSPLPESWVDYARNIACDRAQPSFHRTIALNLLALGGNTRDIGRIEDIASREYDPEIVRAAIVALARTNHLSRAMLGRARRIAGLETTLDYLASTHDLPSLIFSARRTPIER